MGSYGGYRQEGDLYDSAKAYGCFRRIGGTAYLRSLAIGVQINTRQPGHHTPVLLSLRYQLSCKHFTAENGQCLSGH